MNDITEILLCSDLDRTLIPNGREEESEKARPLLRYLARQPGFRLVYVTGRDEKLIADAIADYDLPMPDYAIGDVGTSIYGVSGSPENPEFSPRHDWQEQISRDWQGLRHDDLAELFTDLNELRPQEPEKQNSYKVSYYVDVDADRKALSETMRRRLEKKNIRASIITSVDEQAGVGLVDILPERATKVHAIRFLIEEFGIPESRVVFSGDSGNDLPALTSGLQAVLVKNAAEDVRGEARATVSEKGIESKLYLARGGFLEMNGNYAAGVLEGLVHFLPETEEWLRAGMNRITP